MVCGTLFSSLGIITHCLYTFSNFDLHIHHRLCLVCHLSDELVWSGNEGFARLYSLAGANISFTCQEKI